MILFKNRWFLFKLRWESQKEMPLNREEAMHWSDTRIYLFSHPLSYPNYLSFSSEVVTPTLSEYFLVLSEIKCVIYVIICSFTCYNFRIWIYIKIFLDAPFRREYVLLYRNHRAYYPCHIMWPIWYLINVSICSPSIRPVISRAFISKLPLLNLVNYLKTGLAMCCTNAREPILYAVYTIICFLNGNKRTKFTRILMKETLKCHI